MSVQSGFTVKWYSVFTNAFYFIRRGLYQAVKENAPLLRGNILDFGCGNKPYHDLFTNATSYIGLDIEVSGHTHSNESIDVYYDGKVIPFDAEHFDHVFSTEVFEHIFNIDEVLPEISRVLKPNGYLLITCPFVWPEHERPYDFARYTSFGIKYILEKHGFTVEREMKTGHYWEVITQQRITFIYFFINKPKWLYAILHQLLLLPQILISILTTALMPRVFKRQDLYHSNIILARKAL